MSESSKEHRPRVAGGITEAGTVVGNVYDKYGTANPIARHLVSGFTKALTELVDIAGPETIHEVGCGEGHWVLRWRQQGFEACGSDFSTKVIALAQQNAVEQRENPEVFRVRDIYELSPDSDGADLLVCCEVLEHLEHPARALLLLRQVAKSCVLVSVPREPIWRIMNLLRGRYLRSLGNTPGHVQHWSRAEFLSLLGDYFEIVEIRTPLPWTMALCHV